MTIVGHFAMFDITDEPTTPSIIPTIPPNKLNTSASIRNCVSISLLRAPMDIRDSDFASSFRNRDKHNVHNADAANKQ